MPTINDSLETGAAAESSILAVSVTATYTNTAASKSILVLSDEPPVTISTGNSSSVVVIEAYALLLNTAQATGDVSSTLIVTDLLLNSSAKGTSTSFLTIDEMASSIANAADSIAALDIPQLLVSVAQALSVVTTDRISTFLTDEQAVAKSLIVAMGHSESLTATANASSSVTLLRRVDQEVTSTAAGLGTVVLSSTNPQTFLLLSTAAGASLILLGTTHNVLLESTVDGTSAAWAKDPGRVAWVLNTETAAVGWYDNFDFESIAQPPGKVLAVGPEGLYELTGNTDEGKSINATAVSGLNDFGSDTIKRVDAMYLGYTCDGNISVTAETYESGHPPITYLLEQRLALAPRNSRLIGAKGMWGRYWRMTISNVAGADFEIHDASVDIAVSSRRI